MQSVFSFSVLPKTKPAFMVCIFVAPVGVRHTKKIRDQKGYACAHGREENAEKCEVWVMCQFGFGLLLWPYHGSFSAEEQKAVYKMQKSAWIEQPVIKTIMKQIHCTDNIHIHLN